MVLEKLVSLKTAIKNPLSMFIVGGLVSVVCLFVAFFVFQTSAGIFTSLLVTLAMTPFMINLIRYDEAREEMMSKDIEKSNIFFRHRDILKVYAAFFGGMILSLSIIYLILPEHISGVLFKDQSDEINRIRGKFMSFDNFQKIIINNIGVLFLSFLFSFLFGAGAVFILAWNASVLSAAIGMTAKSIGGFKGLPLAMMSYFPHGSLEILAYFIGGIAGGLISAAITRKKSPRFAFIVKDSLMMMAISTVILILAGAIESIEMAA